MLSWTLEDEKRDLITRWEARHYTVKLAKLSGLFSAKLKDYYCLDCKKIIIDVPSIK